MGRVDELIHGVAGNEMMHGVVGKADKLIHCSDVERVDDLTQRRRGESRRANTWRHGEQVDAQSCGEDGEADTLRRCGEG